MTYKVNPIKFGTDGWRGIIAADFTMERVAKVSPIAAQVLKEDNPNSNLIVVGYDRRFMAEDFAKTAAESLQNAGFDVWLSNSYAPTPAFSWMAKNHNALGALVLTASHNPAKYLGLKVKGSFGGSVSQNVTQKIEDLLSSNPVFPNNKGKLELFDPWSSYIQQLRTQVNINLIKEGISSGKIKLAVDVMHGAASTGLSRILDYNIQEINANRDPLFDGGAPEPLPRYIPKLFAQVKENSTQYPDCLHLGLVFDGDCDRIAAIDAQCNYCSTQVLIPILIEHLATRKSLKGEIVKTVSGSDLIPKIAKLYHLPLFETAVGYKYIAERMLTHQVLIGGEESGGVGYGTHIPERDALLSALYVLEAMIESGKNINELYSNLQNQVDFNSQYDRFDLELENMEQRSLLLYELEQNKLEEIVGKKVTDCLAIDGYKFRLDDDSWLLIRFSGTEPLLRIYSEANTSEAVQENLTWAKNWALTISN
jgi:phosphomannomutase